MYPLWLPVCWKLLPTKLLLFSYIANHALFGMKLLISQKDKHENK